MIWRKWTVNVYFYGSYKYPRKPVQGSNPDPLNQEALFWHRIVFLQEFLAESCQSRLDVLLPKLQEVTLCLSDLISFSGKVRINILSLWYIIVVTELSGKSRWLTVIKLCYFGFQLILRDQFTADVCLNVHHVLSRRSRPLARCLLVRRPALLHLKPFTHWRSTTASSHRSHTPPKQTHTCTDIVHNTPDPWTRTETAGLDLL